MQGVLSTPFRPTTLRNPKRLAKTEQSLRKWMHRQASSPAERQIGPKERDPSHELRPTPQAHHHTLQPRNDTMRRHRTDRSEDRSQGGQSRSASKVRFYTSLFQRARETRQSETFLLRRNKSCPTNLYSSYTIIDHPCSIFE